MNDVKFRYKDTFAVIGKSGQGAADKGSEWIQPLWEAAGTNYAEITEICKKSESGGLFWWGAMNDSNENNKIWSDTGKYMAGCEADITAVVPNGWTKWIIPAQTYLVASATPERYGEVFREVMNNKGIIVVGSVHEYYPVPANPSIMELWFPVSDNVMFCKSCAMPMTRPEDFSCCGVYCRHCYIDGVLRGNILMDELVADVRKLINIESKHPNLVSTPLLEYIKTWLAFDETEKVLAIPTLLSRLIDGQNCDFMGTQWEKEWLADGKVCHCIACTAVRRCISDIKLTEAYGKCFSQPT